MRALMVSESVGGSGGSGGGGGGGGGGDGGAGGAGGVGVGVSPLVCPGVGPAPAAERWLMSEV
jgi:hypothetical protein